jgi:hypothetical protein
LINLIYPHFNVFERLWGAAVEYEQNSISLAEKVASDIPEALLTSRVPDLHPDSAIKSFIFVNKALINRLHDRVVLFVLHVNLHLFHFEIYSYCTYMAVREHIIGEPSH